MNNEFILRNLPHTCSDTDIAHLVNENIILSKYKLNLNTVNTDDFNKKIKRNSTTLFCNSNLDMQSISEKITRLESIGIPIFVDQVRQGIVKFYSSKKKFGYIAGFDGMDIRMNETHISQLEERPLKGGDNVVYNIRQNSFKKPALCNVTKTEAPIKLNGKVVTDNIDNKQKINIVSEKMKSPIEFLETDLNRLNGDLSDEFHITFRVLLKKGTAKQRESIFQAYEIKRQNL